MYSDSRGMKIARVRRIIPGLIVFGVPAYVFLAGCLGMENAITILLAVTSFVVVRRYFKSRREFNRKFRQTGLGKRAQ